MQTVEPAFLCIIATPRTGTDYLCALLGWITGIRSRTEIFHDIGPLSLTTGEIAAIGGAAQKVFRGLEDPALRNWMREHPAVSVRTIHEAPAVPPAKVFSFKIFPGQLPAQTVAERLIPMPRMRFLIVKRRIIDAYISLIKARLIGRWRDVDTTNFRVTLDPENFIRYVQDNLRWYEILSSEITGSGKPGSLLTYEEFAPLDPHAQRMRLLTILNFMGFQGLLPAEIPARPLPPRQDHALTYEQKVMNWAQFVRDPRIRELPTDIFGYF